MTSLLENLPSPEVTAGTQTLILSPPSSPDPTCQERTTFFLSGSGGFIASPPAQAPVAPLLL